MQNKATADTYAGSHPTRGEWIEIPLIENLVNDDSSLTPHGVSGLKYHTTMDIYA